MGFEIKFNKIISSLIKKSLKLKKFKYFGIEIDINTNVLKKTILKIFKES